MQVIPYSAIIHCSVGSSCHPLYSVFFLLWTWIAKRSGWRWREGWGAWQLGPWRAACTHMLCCHIPCLGKFYAALGWTAEKLRFAKLNDWDVLADQFRLHCELENLQDIGTLRTAELQGCMQAVRLCWL